MLHEHSSFNCSSYFINHLCPRDIFEATTCMPLADFSYLGCQFEKGLSSHCQILSFVIILFLNVRFTLDVYFYEKPSICG